MTISSAYFAHRVRLNDSDFSENDNDTVIHNHDDLEPGQTVDGTFDIYFYMQIHLRDICKLYVNLTEFCFCDLLEDIGDSSSNSL